MLLDFLLFFFLGFLGFLCKSFAQFLIIFPLMGNIDFIKKWEKKEAYAMQMEFDVTKVARNAKIIEVHSAL